MGRIDRCAARAGLFFLAAAAAQAAPPDVPVYRSFKDWEVGCDNTRRCTAVGLQPEDYAEVTAFLRVERMADARAAPVVQIALAKEGLAPGDPVMLTIDGQPIPGVTSQRTIDNLESELAYPAIRLVASEVTPFVEALRAGKRLQIATDHANRPEVSLDGAVAALVFIDDVQGRIDTVTALIRPGAQPASAVPTAPAPPVVRPRPAAGGETVAPAVAAAVGQSLAARASEGCSAKDVQAFPLGGGRILAGLPCGGAYNFATEYFIAEAGGERIRPATFPQPGEEGQAAATNTLFGSDADPKSGQISFFSRGRGPGDCGSRGVYAWTGEGFAVVSYAAMHACRGVPDHFWPVLWRSTMTSP